MDNSNWPDRESAEKARSLGEEFRRGVSGDREYMVSPRANGAYVVSVPRWTRCQWPECVVAFRWGVGGGGNYLLDESTGEWFFDRPLESGVVSREDAPPCDDPACGVCRAG